MNYRFVVFISIIMCFLAMAAFYVGQRAIGRSSWAQAHREIVWLALAIFVLLQFLGPYLYRIYPDSSSRLFILHWVSYTAMGVFFSMFFYTLAADLLLGLWKLIARPVDSVPFHQGFLALVLIMTFGSTLIGIAQVVRGPKVYRVDIPIRGLAPQLEGFRIAQISDLHIGPTIGRKYTAKVVEEVNRLDADVVALTGDLVDGSIGQLRNAVELISKIEARNGKFFVTGNHEYYWGVQAWLNEFKRLGLQVLVNEHVLIEHHGTRIAVAGVTDHTARTVTHSDSTDARRAIQGAPDNVVRILLAHQPSVYRDASEAGFDLQLSGHTHGGQFFPWSIVVALAHKYYKGLYRHENMWIYVNRGTGYWGPPIRFGVPAEITLLTLRRQTES
ncbi:MAG TPA: metallophosphoesterase [Acidobacteriota bacterium]|nr:metallophosphoesterase [Acidobacteriota bacterium]